MGNPDQVIRYVITHVNKNGMRQFSEPCKGTHTYETKEKAEALIQSIHKGNPPEFLKFIFDNPETLKAQPVVCWAKGFDPVDFYFDG